MKIISNPLFLFIFSIFAVVVLSLSFSFSSQTVASADPSPTDSCPSSSPTCSAETIEAVQNGLLIIDKVVEDCTPPSGSTTCSPVSPAPGATTQYAIMGKTIEQAVKAGKDTTNWNTLSTSVKWTDFEITGSDGPGDTVSSDKKSVIWGTTTGERHVSLKWDTTFLATGADQTLSCQMTGCTETASYAASTVSPVKIAITFPVLLQDTPTPSPTPTVTVTVTANPTGNPTGNPTASGYAPDQHPSISDGSDSSNSASNLAKTGLAIAGLVLLTGLLFFLAIILRRRKKEDDDAKKQENNSTTNNSSDSSNNKN